jgi:hypothetical protein
MEVTAHDKEAWERQTTDKFKACVGCKHRFKDKKVSIRFSRFRWKEAEEVYGCGFGQLNMTTEVEQLPEQCRLRNMRADKETYRPFVVRKERDNCRTCMVYMDQKPICMGERKVLVCPCKTCEQFMANDKGCMSYKESCREKIQYVVNTEV